MIPIEYFWFALIFMFGLIGSARGLAKELGVSTVVMLSLFGLWEGWHYLFSKFVGTVQGGAPGCGGWMEAAYYGFAMLFIALISYEGYSLSFPVSGGGGIWKALFGFFGGLLNGYLIIGTVWDVLAKACYFSPKLSVVMPPLSSLHNEIVRLLPVSLMDHFSPFIFLVPGMLLLILIVLK